MLIKTGKESEAVLPRKRPPAVAGRTGNWNAPGLASPNRLSLIDPHREAALRQLMGGAESCDSAAKDRHSLLHLVILRQTIEADSGFHEATSARKTVASDLWRFIALVDLNCGSTSAPNVLELGISPADSRRQTGIVADCAQGMHAIAVAVGMPVTRHPPHDPYEHFYAYGSYLGCVAAKRASG